MFAILSIVAAVELGSNGRICVLAVLMYPMQPVFVLIHARDGVTILLAGTIPRLYWKPRRRRSIPLSSIVFLVSSWH